MKHTRLLLLSLAAMFGLPAGSALAQAPELFFKPAAIEEALLSPSGRKLAITTSQGLNRRGLAIIDLESGKAFERVAQFSNGDISGVHWLHDDRLVFTLTGIETRSGQFAAATSMYSTNSTGSDIRRLMLGNFHVLRVPEPVAGQDNERLLVATDASSYGEGQTKPMWLDARSGRLRAVDGLNAPSHALYWLADARGEPRIAVSRDKDRYAIQWRAPGSADWVKLHESSLFEAPFSVAGVDAVGTLYVTRKSGAEGHAWLARYDFNASRPEDDFIVETPGFDYNGLLIDGGKDGKALGVRLWVDGETTVWFDPRMKALQLEADRRFPDRVNRIMCRRCGEGDMVALVRSYSDKDPGRLFVYRAKPPPGESHWRSVGAVRDDVRPEQMATMELHRIKARDGRDLPVWVTRPAGAHGALPAVVWVHDGPWQRGNYWGWHAFSQFIASHGYVVIEPEFRGGTGFGAAHFQAGFKQWGQAMQNDVADALRWAQAEKLASPQACIAGEGYGGYSALMGLVHDADLFQCGVAGSAPTDLSLLVKGAWWLHDGVRHEDRKYALPELVGDGDRDAAMLHAQSPVNQAASIKAPVMLVVDGAAGLAQTHGERMRKALRDAGKEPIWVVTGKHMDFAVQMAAFLGQHLKPASPPQAP